MGTPVLFSVFGSTLAITPIVRGCPQKGTHRLVSFTCTSQTPDHCLGNASGCRSQRNGYHDVLHNMESQTPSSICLPIKFIPYSTRNATVFSFLNKRFMLAILPIPVVPVLRPSPSLENRTRSWKHASRPRKRKSSTTRKRGLLRVAIFTTPYLSGSRRVNMHKKSCVKLARLKCGETT